MAARTSMLSSAGDARPGAVMPTMADVSATQIAFVVAGQLWLVPREGGVASGRSAPGR